VRVNVVITTVWATCFTVTGVISVILAINDVGPWSPRLSRSSPWCCRPVHHPLSQDRPGPAGRRELQLTTTVRESDVTATTPHLLENFALVPDELAVTDLPVTGTIPPELTGWYLRNGPNPRAVRDLPPRERQRRTGPQPTPRHQRGRVRP
jgi:hypothetical protein